MFKKDLDEAHALEDTLAALFKKEFGGTIKQAPKDKSFTPWDFMWDADGEDFKFEVKQDKHTYTGNIAIEIGRTVKNGFRPTGISTSKADAFIYCFEGRYWMIHTRDLKELIKDCFTIKGGDGGRAHLKLLSKSKFFSKAINLKNFY